MKCPCCGAAELVHDTRDIVRTYKGQSRTIPAVTGDFCPSCGETVLDRVNGDRYSELVSQFHRKINGELFEPGLIARVRKKLDLDQREAGEIFGGGSNAFSRYENGKTKPPVALVKLLKVLERHPDLLPEVKAA